MQRQTESRSRENVQSKGRRYLVEGRVRIHACDELEGFVQADVRGNGAVYVTGYDEDGWRCSCPARGRCAHIYAVQQVTALQPREAP